MKFTELSDHLHDLRVRRTRGAMARGRMMPVMDIWQGALDSDLTTVSDIRVLIDVLPLGFEGIFIRYSCEGKDCVIIATGKGLSKARQRFVIAKELMHCWSPIQTYVRDAEAAANLAQALNYSGTVDEATLHCVQADRAAIMAAAEVILPHYSLERDIAAQLPIEEVASRHGLDIEIARDICAVATIPIRKSGCL